MGPRAQAHKQPLLVPYLASKVLKGSELIKVLGSQSVLEQLMSTDETVQNDGSRGQLRVGSQTGGAGGVEAGPLRRPRVQTWGQEKLWGVIPARLLILNWGAIGQMQPLPSQHSNDGPAHVQFPYRGDLLRIVGTQVGWASYAGD